MRLFTLPGSIALLSVFCMGSSSNAQNFNTSTKRGLIDIAATASSDTAFLLNGTDMTWYYNYGPKPSLSSTTYPNLEFVPMQFSTSTDFLSTIKSLIKSGVNITHVMAYNEPDGTTDTGGSAISPLDAAENWISQLEPLRAMGVKVGAPAVTGAPSGFTWLTQFFDACNGRCTADFMTVHWYGNFEGLASNIGQKRAAYPNLSLWITEYALPDASLEETQAFFNQSAQFFDSQADVSRYSYFGSFRSDKSNVGPNVAMLDDGGGLTDIGSWYNGGKATNNSPGSNSGGHSGAGGLAVSSGMGLVTLGAVVMAVMS